MFQPIKISHSVLCQLLPPQGEQILCVTIEGNQVTNCKYRPIPQCTLLNYMKKKDATFFKKLMKVQFHKDLTPWQIKSALERGVDMSGAGHFSFLGCSEEQLRKRVCFMMCGTDSNAYNLLSKFLQIDEIRDLDKKAEKIALLFTECKNVFEGNFDQVDPDAYIEMIQGMMSTDVARGIKETLQLENYTPSVVQISFQGYKGILVTSKTLKASQVCFPESMQKFEILEPVHDACTSLGIVDYSHPHSNGYLNEMMILYLQKRGIQGNYLKSLEHDFTNLLQGLPNDWDQAERCLKIRGKEEELEKLHQKHCEEDVPTGVRKVLWQLKDEMEEVRSLSSRGFQVLVPKSREVFGVKEPQNLLDKNECFFNITLWGDDQKAFEEEDQVVVIRKPCRDSMQDIQVLKINRSTLLNDKYSHLKDCIVFSSKSSFPSIERTAKDEKYFVSWDDKLTPQRDNLVFRVLDEADKFIIDKCLSVQERLTFAPPFLRSGMEKHSNLKRMQMRELHVHFASFKEDCCNAAEKLSGQGLSFLGRTVLLGLVIIYNHI